MDLKFLRSTFNLFSEAHTTHPFLCINLAKSSLFLTKKTCQKKSAATSTRDSLALGAVAFYDQTLFLFCFVCLKCKFPLWLLWGINKINYREN